MTTDESPAAVVAVALSGAVGAEVVPVSAAAWRSWPDEDRREHLRALAVAAAERTGGPVRAVVSWWTPVALAPRVSGTESRTLEVTARPPDAAAVP